MPLYMCKMWQQSSQGSPSTTPAIWKRSSLGHATHLGHELHQSGSMEQDCKVKRAMFIDNSIEIREVFHFALARQVLEAVKLYSLHCYGSMLWDFSGRMFGQFCRSWNTCVKLVHEVPRSTHTYLVENFLADEFLPVRTELFLCKLQSVKKWDFSAL